MVADRIICFRINEQSLIIILKSHNVLVQQGIFALSTFISCLQVDEPIMIVAWVQVDGCIKIIQQKDFVSDFPPG